MKMIVRTQSGSVYRIRRDEDHRYFMSADNVPNPNSDKVEGEWEIQQPMPWPPILGNPLYMPCIHLLEHGHPNRLPGGGKYTSRVVEIITPVENCLKCGHVHWTGAVTICGEDCKVCEGTEPLAA